MANPTIQYHQGAPIVTQVWDSIYAVLGTTAPQSASELAWSMWTNSDGAWFFRARSRSMLA